MQLALCRPLLIIAYQSLNIQPVGDIQMVIASICVAHACHQQHNTQKLNNSMTSTASSNSKSVDISHQGFRILPQFVISRRAKIENMKADGNAFTENVFNMPVFPRLHSLSIRQNKVKNIGLLVENLNRACPSLVDLSLEGNPGWPVNDDINCKKYKEVLVKSLKGLKRLNGKDTYRARAENSSASASRVSSNFSLDCSTNYQLK